MLTTLTGTKVPEIGINYIRNGFREEKVKITTVCDAYDAFMSVWNLDIILLQEEFKVIYLNHACYVLGVYSHTTGSATSVQIDPRYIIGLALKMDTHSIILAHNHPSENLKPSRQDHALTAKLVQGAGYFSIKVLDHLIISPDGYHSMADNCEIPDCI